MSETEAQRVIAHLVTPFCVQRAWDYPGPEYEVSYPCWTVCRINSQIDIAYCEGGFGPAWGIVFSAESASIGMDAAWYERLWEAFMNAA